MMTGDVSAVAVGRQVRSPGSVRRSRWIIGACILPVFVFKVVLAARTFGTNDVVAWGDFLGGERSHGPVGIYGLTQFPNRSFYNHPPLIGYYLALLNWVQDLGLPYRFTLRTVSSLADVGTTFLTFELLRRIHPVRHATAAAVVVGWSPILVMVSGFHGNTDPMFIMFALLSVYLLLHRRWPALAGAAIAVAVGIKIVPMVLIPALAVYAWKRNPKALLRAGAGFVVVFGLSWGPALAGQATAVRLDVIGYGGVGHSPWGLVEIAHWFGDPWWIAALEGPGRSVVVIICAVLPAVAVWRRPDCLLLAVAWSLIGFLVLAPTWGVQYMVWPVVACAVVGLGWAVAFNVFGGLALFLIYDRWSGGLPWYQAWADAQFRNPEIVLMMIAWLVLVAAWVQATRTIIGPVRSPTRAVGRRGRG
jgi:hypothetical protein